MNKARRDFEREAAEVAEKCFLRSALSACSCLILFLLFSSPAFAHEVRPAYLELRQTGPDTYDALWKVPGLGDNLRLGLYVEMPAGCTNVTTPRASMINNAFTERWTVQRPGGFSGGTIHIAGLSATMTDVLVRLERLDGTTQVTRLTPSAPSFVVEAAPRPMQVAATYLKLGVEHILLGIDHLLFVLALLILVKGARRLIATVTAFTLAHSLTLAGATLGFVHVPGPPVEAAIALSIVFVAAEILRMRGGARPVPGRSGFDGNRSVEENWNESSGFVAAATGDRSRSVPSLTSRAPWIVAFTFGLLHGFGFAGALGEVGLPQSAIPVALLFFNVGVEVGQLLFIASVFAIIALARQVSRRSGMSQPVWAWRVPPYAIGSLAMFWVIQRIAAF